jgi:hypothetical protein
VRAYAVNRGELQLLQQRTDGWTPGQDGAGVVAAAALPVAGLTALRAIPPSSSKSLVENSAQPRYPEVQRGGRGRDASRTATAGPGESSRTPSRIGENQTGLGKPRACELVGEPQAIDGQVTTERLGNLATTVGNRPENSKVSLAQRVNGGDVHRGYRSISPSPVAGIAWCGFGQL